MAKKISYSVRDFAGLREELVSLTKQYYPDLIKNFNDASIYSVLLDLNAAVSDNLHFHIDRVWQETMLDFAQQKQSLFHIAKTYGIKIPGLRPSVALCDFSINVPVADDKESEIYEGKIRAGAQISGGGQVFETIEDIDFRNPFNSRGEPNRLKIPNKDSRQKTMSYTITKREAVINGTTKTYRRVISELDQKPFLKIYLPEINVLGVTGVISKDGTNYVGNPTYDEYLNPDNKWYEVYSLVENKVFVSDPTAISDKDNFVAGNFIDVTNKFVTEFSPTGYFSLTFGSGNVDPMDNLDNHMDGTMKVNIATFLNNLSLGNIPKPNSTLFIKYRIGGGKNTNLGVDVITSVDNVDFVLDNVPKPSVGDQTIQSLRVTNVTPAIGGADAPSIEEIRNMVAYNFSAQNRAVTLNDYKTLIETMPSTFGAPAKVNVMEEGNTVYVKILSYDKDGALISTVSSILANNITNYLRKFQMLNDKVIVESGEVVDLRLEIDLVIDKNETQRDIMRAVRPVIIDYFSPEKRKMGDPLFVGELKKIISNVSGVINLTGLKVFHLIGGKYSSSTISQPYKDPTTKEIDLTDEVIYMKSNQIFQIRFPGGDIQIRTKNLTSPIY